MPDKPDTKTFTITVDPDVPSYPAAHFVIDPTWVFGPSISYVDGKDLPTVSADWHKGMLQFLVFEELMGDQRIAVRFKDGKIAEIEIPREMEKLIVYENQTSAWIEERDALSDGKRSARRGALH